MEIVKELDDGVDIDLKGIGFFETRNSSSKSKKMKPSSMNKIRGVPTKESNKNSGHKIEINKSFVFQADQSLVIKSKYLSESQTFFLRKDPQSAEELNSVLVFRRFNDCQHLYLAISICHQ